MIHFLQEIFIKALMNKAKSEGKKRKFFQLFNSILSLREVVNEVTDNFANYSLYEMLLG